MKYKHKYKENTSNTGFGNVYGDLGAAHIKIQKIQKNTIEIQT